MNVADFIDLHFHIGPEIIYRKFDTLDKLAKAEKGKIRAIALKNHICPTWPIVETYDNPKFIGSVVLNHSVGGMNPDAILASAGLTESPIFVWFPTIHANNHLKKIGYDYDPDWGDYKIPPTPHSKIVPVPVFDKKLKPTDSTISVLNAIKRTGSILATGHLSQEETVVLVQAATDIGIRKIIITHPIWPYIKMDIDTQKELSRLRGVYIEHTYAMRKIDKKGNKEIASQINEVGPERCIISSDMGQKGNPTSSQAMEIFTEMLKKIGKEELELMGSENPLKLLDK